MNPTTKARPRQCPTNTSTPPKVGAPDEAGAQEGIGWGSQNTQAIRPHQPTQATRPRQPAKVTGQKENTKELHNRINSTIDSITAPKRLPSQTIWAIRSAIRLGASRGCRCRWRTNKTLRSLSVLFLSILLPPVRLDLWNIRSNTAEHVEPLSDNTTESEQVPTHKTPRTRLLQDELCRATRILTGGILILDSRHDRWFNFVVADVCENRCCRVEPVLEDDKAFADSKAFIRRRSFADRFPTAD